MYSFGRRNAYNPFYAGFVHEGVNKGIFKRFKNTKTKIYSLEITEEKYKKIEKIIYDMQKSHKLYKFNFIGLLAVALNVRIKRERFFYCAEFVKYVLEQSQVISLPDIIKPCDFEKVNGLTEVYQGTFCDYKNN